jgi:hypothetical protein
MSVTSLILLVLATTPCPVASALASPAGMPGTGEPDDPYQVATADQLAAIGQDPNLWDRRFVLVTDVDLQGWVFTRAVIAPDLDPSTPEFDGPGFSGSLDGQGYRVLNMQIAGDGGYLGLFGAIIGGHVRNLGIVGADITSDQSWVGGLVGWNLGTLAHCHATGAVTGVQGVGGLVGAGSHGLVVDCFSTATAVGEQRIGGLVGYSEFDHLVNCYSTGAASGAGRFTGGLVGHSYYSMAVHCYSTGQVAGMGTSVGGLVGYNAGTVTHCFWDTESSGRKTSQGGTGLGTTKMMDVQTFLAAGWDFSGESGNGTSETWVMPEGGGYPILSESVGQGPAELDGHGTIEDPYRISTAADLGAMLGSDPGACYRLVADIDLSATTWSMAVVPVFSGTFDGGDLTIRGLAVRGEDEVGLFGYLTEKATVRDLYLKDASVSGTTRVGAVAGESDGTLTGCQVTGLVTASHDAVGGLVGNNLAGTLTSCRSAAKVSGTGDLMGGLAGQNAGTLTDCCATGTVSGTGNLVGGLAGFNGGKAVRCWSTGAVTGRWGVGGLVGQNAGSTTDCRSSGAVTATSDLAGGLAGWNSGRMVHCYSTGRVTVKVAPVAIGGLAGSSSSGGTADGCFWNIASSNCSTSAGGTGLSTTQMMDIQTFLAAGWDFVNTWTICPRDYPRLRWEDARCAQTE